MATEGEGDLLTRLRRASAHLSPGHQRIAAYVAGNPHDAAFESAARIAARCGVSESSVVRFAAAVGYDGFPALSQALQAIVKGHLSLPERMHHRPRELAADAPADELLRDALDLAAANVGAAARTLDVAAFEATLAALLDARTVYAVGLRGSAHLAALAAVLLGKAGADARALTCGDVTLFDDLRSVGPGDAVAAFSFARYTRRAVEALRLARERGATTIAVTDAPLTPAASVAEHVLVVPVASHAFNHSYVAAVALIDALVLGWTTRAEARTLASLEAFERVLPSGDLMVP